jgi:hypothetical protein
MLDMDSVHWHNDRRLAPQRYLPPVASSVSPDLKADGADLATREFIAAN